MKMFSMWGRPPGLRPTPPSASLLRVIEKPEVKKLPTKKKGVDTSVDTARKSACATVDELGPTKS